MPSTFRVFISAAVVAGSAYGSAPAQTATTVELTDLRVVAVQAAIPPDPSQARAYIDGTENKYRQLRIVFTTSADLAKLSRDTGRDVRVFYYPCRTAGTPENADTAYSRDQQVYDAQGAITHDRAVENKPELEKFRGIYFFYLPTTSQYRAYDYPQIGGGWDFYSSSNPLEDVCFLLPHTSNAFHSNAATILLADIKKALSERPIKR